MSFLSSNIAFLNAHSFNISLFAKPASNFDIHKTFTQNYATWSDQDIVKCFIQKELFFQLSFFFFPLGGSSYIIQTKIMCSFINIFYIKIKFDSSGQTGNVDVWSSCRSDQMGHHFKHAVWLFFTEVLLDPCRTWCPSSSCQAVCQLNEAEVQLPQPVQCPQCSLRFCSACRADCHSGQACQESLPITTFLPGENGYLL